MPIKYVYDYIIKPPSLGGLDEYIESDENFISRYSNLFELLPPQVQLMSNQRRDLCRCEICILEKLLKDSLNALILRLIIHIEQLSEYSAV